MKTTAGLLLSLATLSGCGSSIGAAADDSPRFPHVPIELPAPRLDSISPTFGSPSMIVTLRGAGFPDGAQVFFGDTQGEILSQDSHSISAHPAAATEGARGSVPVTVRVGATVLGPLAFELGARGDIHAIDTHPAYSAGDVALLADGATLVTDPDDERLYRIERDGWVSMVASLPGLSPLRLSTVGGGDPLVGTNSGIASFAGGEAVVVLENGASPLYSAVREGNVLFALAVDGWIERATEDGREIIATPAGDCAGAADLTAAGGKLWIVTYTGAICSIDPATFDVTPLPLTGPAPMEAWSIDGASGSLVVAGVFAGYLDGVATITLDGEVSVDAYVPAGAYGAIAMPNGDRRTALSSGHVADVGASLFRLVTAPVARLAEFQEIDRRRFVAGGTGYMDFAFVAEIDPMGRTRILANDDHPDAWIGLFAEGEDTFVVAARNDSTLLRVGAAGVTVIATHGAEIAGIARHPAGGYVVADYEGGIARYDDDGELADAAFVTNAGVALGLAYADGQFYIATGDRILTVGVEGGDAEVLVDSGTALGFNDVFSSEGRVFVSDGDDSGLIYERTSEGNLVSVGAGDAISAVSAGADGALLVADVTTPPYVMLP